MLNICKRFERPIFVMSVISVQPPQMGSMGMMTPPTMMYSQPVMRPPNPFGSVSSAQVGARRRDSSATLKHGEVSNNLSSYQVELIDVSIVCDVHHG